MNEIEIEEIKKEYTKIIKRFEVDLQELCTRNHVVPEIECDTDVYYTVGSPIGIPIIRIRLHKLLFNIC